MFVSADCWMRDLRTACRYDELTRYAVPTAELYSVRRREISGIGSNKLEMYKTQATPTGSKCEKAADCKGAPEAESCRIVKAVQR